MIIFDNIEDKVLVEMISNGAVGVIPTDTLLGIACKASDKEAVVRLYELKNRQNKPGTIIAANIEQLIAIGFKKRYLTAVRHFWPNSISIVIPCGFNLSYLHLGVGSIAVRIPKDDAIINLLTLTGPLITSSANTPGKPEARNLQEAMNYFGDKLDYYVNSTVSKEQKPSTIIRIVDDAIEVLREGSIKISEKTGEIYE